MKKLINLISEEVTKAFVSAGYDEKYGKVTLSNRPDLCEFQCNGAMAAAKEYKCAPFMISDKVAALLESDEMFESVESVKPGFLNIKMDTAFLAKYMNDMKDDEGRHLSRPLCHLSLTYRYLHFSCYFSFFQEHPDQFRCLYPQPLYA